MKNCPHCEKDLRPCNYDRHIESCLKPKKFMVIRQESWLQENGKYKCPYCDKEYQKNGIGTHIWRKHIPNNKNWGGGQMFKGKGGNTSWNKGLTKDNSERVRKSAETFKRRVKEGKIIPSFTGRTHTKESREKISKGVSLNNKGGRCKWYNIDGVNLQGTWERDLAIKMNELGIEWMKIGIGKKEFTFKYGEKHYTPDFYLKNIDKLLEVKGYWWGDDENKMKLVVEENDLLKNKLIIIRKELFNKLKESKNKTEFIQLLF